ncbi:glutathione S-transferase [Aspergillus japonicus CBS 114.51]|uniref:Glutathione S-transferase n=1 Tax=Aspergillus japonicus CBS 114.51 TaxID=1448312 RepID=A0A8T8WS30_ASPJA|nr:glutathione S-transferase [Aspergillus japonicus CBS 114.51]RAH78480.1 glutathione S-transferase [Aspergillus japonicus CBS 114.51]
MPVPDADIHPEATGPAKALVASHQAEQPLKFYAGWFCPFVQRVWLALEEKQIPYQYIEVNPYHKAPSFLALNPRGLVPTITSPDESGSARPLYESTVILEYLEEAYPTHTPALLPKDAYLRARARIWIDYVTSRIIPAFHRFLQHQPTPASSSPDTKQTGRGGGGGGGGGDELHSLREEFRATLKEFARELHPQGPYFLGEELSLVDVVLAPWAVRLWVFDEFKGGLGVPAPGEADSEEEERVWARWRRWVAAVEGRRSVRETLSERDWYLPIYQRYAEDKAQSELARAVRKGRGVP